jgi:hypothetical protein
LVGLVITTNYLNPEMNLRNLIFVISFSFHKILYFKYSLLLFLCSFYSVY